MENEGHFNNIISEFQETRVRRDTNVLRFYFKSWLNFFRKQMSQTERSRSVNKKYSGQYPTLKRGLVRGSKLKKLTVGRNPMKMKETSTDEESGREIDFMEKFCGMRDSRNDTTGEKWSF